MIETIGTILGGGVLGAVAKYARDVYVARARREEHAERTDEKRAKREDDITRDFAVDAIAERKATMAKVEQQATEITRLSVAVARCEEKHAASELRERAKDAEIEEQRGEIASLRTTVDLQAQLVERQREEIAKLDGDVSSLTTQLTDLRDSFDAFVKGAMGVRSISEVPGA